MSQAPRIKAKRPCQHAMGDRPGSPGAGPTSPALERAPRSSHRIALAAATKSPSHSCPPGRVRLGLGGLCRRPAGSRAPIGGAHLPPASRRTSLPRAPEPPPSLSPAACALAWAPAAATAFIGHRPLLARPTGPLPAPESRRSRPRSLGPALSVPQKGDRGRRRTPLCVRLEHGRGPAIHLGGLACSLTNGDKPRKVSTLSLIHQTAIH